MEPKFEFQIKKLHEGPTWKENEELKEESTWRNESSHVHIYIHSLTSLHFIQFITLPMLLSFHLTTPCNSAKPLSHHPKPNLASHKLISHFIVLIPQLQTFFFSIFLIFFFIAEPSPYLFTSKTFTPWLPLLQSNLFPPLQGKLAPIKINISA